MARKELIYSVNKNTNTIVRVSRSYLAALEFADDSMYICTSPLAGMKKGDIMAEVGDVL